MLQNVCHRERIRPDVASSGGRKIRRETRLFIQTCPRAGEAGTKRSFLEIRVTVRAINK